MNVRTSLIWTSNKLLQLLVMQSMNAPALHGFSVNYSNSLCHEHNYVPEPPSWIKWFSISMHAHVAEK